MTWNQRYKAMLLHFGWGHKEIAEITGYNVASIRTQINRKFPPWMKVAIVVFEKMKERDG